MALPTTYESVTPAAAERPNSRSRLTRVLAGAAVMLAVATLIALAGQSTEQTELVAVNKNPLNALAVDFLKSGASMTVSDINKDIKAFTANPHTELLFPGRTQMLASGPEAPTQSLEGESLLCQKKQIILDKFDALLKKLGGQELSANITMDKVSAEFKEAMSSWLGMESSFRLQVEKAKDASKGAGFAQSEYEKWKTANKQAKVALDDALARHAKERLELADERELIKMIMRYIGVLNDVKATEKSIAAGGVDSVKDATTGVSDPYNMGKKKAATVAELKEKFAELKAVAAKTKVAGQAQKLAVLDKHFAHTTQLPVYAETTEVAQILKDMLDDLEARLKIIDTVDEQMKKLVDDTQAKMVEWETKLVTLSSEADKAKEKMLSAKVEREKLNGEKKVSQATYDSTSAAYNLSIGPWEREIYVITMIKIKINEHCAAVAAAPTAASAV